MDSALFGPCAYGTFAVVLMVGAAHAQVSLETQLETGLWRVSVGAEKTTFVGQYGTYVEPAIARAWNVFWRGPPPHAGSDPARGGSGSAASGSAVSGSAGSGSAGSVVRQPQKRPDFWHTLLPSGKLPRDLRVRYEGVPGGYVSLMFEPKVMRLWAGLKPRISVEAMYDMNAISGYAPSGFGILTDPTRGYASAAISAAGVELALPIWGFETGNGFLAFYAGHGWMRETSFTHGTVKSVFLQFSTSTSFHAIIQTYSLTAEWRPPTEKASLLDIPNFARFSGADLLMQGYGTEHMWTIGVTGSLIWKL